MEAILDRVLRTQSDLLAGGEQYLAAGRVRRSSSAVPWTSPLGELVAPMMRANPQGLRLPAQMIWATSDTSLRIWAVDRVTGRRPKALLATLPFGAGVELLSIGAASSAGLGYRHAALVIRGRPIHFEVPEPLAIDLASRAPRHDRQPRGFRDE